MKRQNLNLLLAPIGYQPNCTTRHDDASKVMRQTFPGDRVVFDWHQAEGKAIALVDDEIVGEWSNPTIGKWYDILYTLETRFSNLITI